MASSRNTLSISMAIAGAFHHRLYDDGIKRHLLRIFPIIVKSQMPDSRIQVLDKASLVQTDGSRLSPCSFGLKQVPLLSCNQSAAVQELNKVILRVRTSTAV